MPVDKRWAGADEQRRLRAVLEYSSDLLVVLDADGRAGARAEVECRVAHADGSWRWMHVRAANLLDHPDVGGVIVNALDFTRERDAEATARQSDERLRSLVRNANDLTVVCDPDGIPRWATPSLERVFGLTLDDIGGDRFHAEFVHPDDTAALIQAFQWARDQQGEGAPVEVPPPTPRRIVACCRGHHHLSSR